MEYYTLPYYIRQYAFYVHWDRLKERISTHFNFWLQDDCTVTRVIENTTTTDVNNHIKTHKNLLLDYYFCYTENIKTFVGSKFD